jgi:3-dehydroquinate synthase
MGSCCTGKAIAIGMVGSARLAAKFGYSPEIAEETERIFTKFGLPVRIPSSCDTEEIMGAMLHDKKFSEGKMVFVVPTAIGKVEIRNDVPSSWVREIVDGLREGN